MTEHNHIFVRFLAPLTISVSQAVAAVRCNSPRSLIPPTPTLRTTSILGPALFTPTASTLTSHPHPSSHLVEKHQKAVAKTFAMELEIVVPVADPVDTHAEPRVLRFVVSFALSVAIDVYEEVLSGGATNLRRLSGEEGVVTPLEPYPLLTVVDQKRLKCNKLASTYAYDFLHMFEIAAQNEWDRYAARRSKPGTPNHHDLSKPAQKVSTVELVLSKDGSRVEPLKEPRAPGQNKAPRIPRPVSRPIPSEAKPPPPLQVGMLAWRMTLLTPEYPDGRDIIVIANDITFQQGTFGPLEDAVFEKARSRRDYSPRSRPRSALKITALLPAICRRYLGRIPAASRPISAGVDARARARHPTHLPRGQLGRAPRHLRLRQEVLQGCVGRR